MTLSEAMEAAEAAMRAEARSIDRDSRRRAAATYRRSALVLCNYLPTGLVNEALTSDSPKVTWQVIRHLCRQLRALQQDFRPCGVGTLRIFITCEIHLWRRQKDAEATRGSLEYVSAMNRALWLAAE